MLLPQEAIHMPFHCRLQQHGQGRGSGISCLFVSAANMSIVRGCRLQADLKKDEST